MAGPHTADPATHIHRVAGPHIADPAAPTRVAGTVRRMDPRLDGPLDGEFRWRLVAESATAGELAEALTDAEDRIRAAGGGTTQLWIRSVDDDLDETARHHGFVPYRDLWQLRCDLPVDDTDLAVRPFRPADAEEFLAVNNRAFSWHPEQGGMTRADLDSRTAEPWFDPEGFLLHEREGRLAGFCWTKEHHDTQPPMGEIYVIAVDPDFAGTGLGSALTRAGLAHLAARGLTTGMLYVESDNVAANRTYERIGFRRHHTDRAYRRELEAS